MKKIVLLGSTGSIGENTLRVVEALPAHLCVIAVGVEKNYVRALEQAREFGARVVAVTDPEAAERCAREAPSGIDVLAGPEGIEEAARLEEADVVVCAVVGMAGLAPVMAALECGTDVALATKEVLVAAGALVMQACARSGARLLPVDSEQSAIFQCLTSAVSDVRRLVLTASGGPFWQSAGVDFDTVTIEQVLAHPSWNMGKKVSVDSATLMNKGLEIMETGWLFDVPLARIDVILHQESIVHSMVEFRDGSVIAQLSPPDMRFAIQYALTYPERHDGGLPQLDLAATEALHFGKPDLDRFPCLQLARQAALRGGTMPAVLNAANEVAVETFLAGDIPFSGIWHLVERAMKRHDVVNSPDLDAIIDADAWARAVAREK